MKESKEIVKKQEGEGLLDIQGLFAKAVETGNIEVVERLMAVRRELRSERARQEFMEAVKGFQAEVKPITMDCVVKNKDGTVRYKYASLKQILKEIQPLLDKWGLSISFDTIPGDKNTLTIKCILSHISGHSEVREFTIPVDTSQHMSDIQRWGSTLTYAKRYALVSTLNLIAEEDIDGLNGTKENGADEVKVKRIAILDDGTIVEQKQEVKQETEKTQVKQEGQQVEKKIKKKESDAVDIDELKKELLDEIRKYYKILLSTHTKEQIEKWLEIAYEVKLENLINTSTFKLQRILEGIKEEAKKVIEGGK
ncbi:MAG: ERF family protein [Thermodesulfovibrio sp.]|nr:ERF family protein [Thermodesulfovibrio sp.]